MLLFNCALHEATMNFNFNFNFLSITDKVCSQYFLLQATKLQDPLAIDCYRYCLKYEGKSAWMIKMLYKIKDYIMSPKYSSASPTDIH